MEQPVRIVLFVVFLLFSGTVHELCHALAADHFGDPTPGMNNRLTMNPVPHIDPIWTLIMPLVLLVASGGSFAFGGAKPVSMNPANFRNPERDFTIAAALGPLSNFVLAGIGLIITFILTSVFLPSQFVIMVLWIFYFTNIILGCFNLIPIPPLDGSRILRYYLPPDLQQQYDRLSGMGGMILVLILAVTGIFGKILTPFIRLSEQIFYLSVQSF